MAVLVYQRVEGNISGKQLFKFYFFRAKAAFWPVKLDHIFPVQLRRGSNEPVAFTISTGREVGVKWYHL